jgi:hypothetical protein
MSAAEFFDAARALKRELTGAAGGLTQPEVDALNAIIGRWNPPPPPQSDIPDDYWPMLAQIESGSRPYVKSPSSSASGLYQFVRSTWLALGGDWGSDLSQAFGGLKPSIDEQLQRVKKFTEENASVLRAHGVPINKASLYAAHFFGPVTATRVILADVNDRADLIAGAAAASANPSILSGKTVGQFLVWLHGKTGEWAR